MTGKVAGYRQKLQREGSADRTTGSAFSDFGEGKIATTLALDLSLENWTELVSSERLTGAALDRLIHGCHILETKAESY